MPEANAPPEPLKPDFEPSFLKNRITFASNLRVDASLALYERWKASKDSNERRLLFFSVHQQMCMAMEDLGAHLYAYREKQSGGDYITALVTYGGPDAYLYDLFEGRTKDQIIFDFGFGEDVPPFLAKHGYTDEHRERAGENFYAHFETVAKQQKKRMDICNKLKHGATVYLADSDKQLGIVIRRQGKPEPWRLSYNQAELDAFMYLIATCSHATKEILFQYLSVHHPETAQEVLDWDYAVRDIERSLALLKRFDHVGVSPDSGNKMRIPAIVNAESRAS